LRIVFLARWREERVSVGEVAEAVRGVVYDFEEAKARFFIRQQGDADFVDAILIPGVLDQLEDGEFFALAGEDLSQAFSVDLKPLF
jgi:hypothetical protein